MNRPFASKRPIGPLADMTGKPHQDLLLVLDDTFTGMPSSIRAIADKSTQNTGLSLTEDDVSVRMNSDDNMTIIIHTGGPDVTHSDVMAVEEIVAQQTNSNVKSTIVRAKV
jgi:hypothetical protein